MSKTIQKNVKADTKGRQLLKGESQRPDGRYQYRYTDADGKTRYLYSYRLLVSDVTPQGKKDAPPLRVQEKAVEDTLNNGVNYYDATHMTLNDAHEKWLNECSSADADSQHVYRQMYDSHIRGTLGSRKVSDLQPSDIRVLINQLDRDGYRTSTMRNILRQIEAPLAMLVDDGILSRNAAKIALKNVGSKGKESKEKVTLGDKQTASLLSFVSQSDTYSTYLPLIVIMCETGMRVSEVCGLCWRDIDWKNNVIQVRRQLCYYQTSGSYQRKLKSPKSKDGIRDIPMTGAVRKQLTRLHLDSHPVEPLTYEEDGKEYADFVFSNRDGKSLINKEVDSLLVRIIEAYNSTLLDGSDISRLHPHMFRHNFATTLDGLGYSVRTIQGLMGHSENSAAVTMSYIDQNKEKGVEAMEDYGEHSPARAYA